jgi:uncharacterized membrane protein
MTEKTKKRNVIKKSELNISHPNKLPLSFGQKAADKLTRWAGSWTFILSFAAFLILWMLFNTTWLIFGATWDEKPFILLNLILSCLAAFQAPIILMSQNREAQKDRQRAEYDYAVNRKAEKHIEEIRSLVKRLDRKVK